MPTLIAELDQRVTFQREGAKVSDGMGGYSASWQDLADRPTVWAKVRAAKGREAVTAGQQDDAVQYAVTIRYRGDITADMRLMWRSRPMNIINVADEGARREWLQLDCMAGVAL